MAEKAFSGLKVVEIGNFITAPFCAKVFADGGAEVIKIEEPGKGDESRKHGPFPGDVANPEKSGLFLYMNNNKKGITLKLKDPQGKRILKKLLKDADILVWNCSPKESKELGIDYDSLKNEFPKLIVTAITPYGLTGPYKDFKGYSLNVSAMNFVMNSGGDVGREPLDHPMSFSDLYGGIAGVVATEFALFARDKTGKGQLCDVASFQANIGWTGQRFMAIQLHKYKQNGVVQQGRNGDHMSPPGTPGRSWPGAIVEVKDGDIWAYTIDGTHIQRFIELLGSPEWSKQPKYKCENPKLLQYHYETMHDEMDALIADEMKKRTKAEWYEGFLKLGMPFAPLMTIEDLIKSPQSKARHDYTEMDHPVAGRLTYPSHPAVLSESPFTVDQPAPMLGQHNEEIYCKKLGYSKKEMMELQRAGII